MCFGLLVYCQMDGNWEYCLITMRGNGSINGGAEIDTVKTIFIHFLSNECQYLSCITY